MVEKLDSSIEQFSDRYLCLWFGLKPIVPLNLEESAFVADNVVIAHHTRRFVAEDIVERRRGGEWYMGVLWPQCNRKFLPVRQGLKN